MAYKATEPTVYVVHWPDLGVVKAGYSRNQAVLGDPDIHPEKHRLGGGLAMLLSITASNARKQRVEHVHGTRRNGTNERATYVDLESCVGHRAQGGLQDPPRSLTKPQEAASATRGPSAVNHG